MQKEATTDLLRLALLGMLTGGGAYGAMRLARDIPEAAKKPEKPKDQLNLTLPSARLGKQGNAPDAHFMDYLGPALGYGGGAVGGFMGASKLYEVFKKKQLEEDNKKVEAEYLKALQAAHQKVAETQTPLIDEFLKGVLTKAGEELKKESSFGFLPDMPTAGPIDTIGHLGQAGAEGFSKTRLGSAAIAAWLLAAMGSGGATYWLGKKMDKNKQENNQRTTLPSEIKLNAA